MKHSIEVFQYLVDQGHDLHIITARPSSLHIHTQDWVSRNNLPVKSIRFADIQTKSQICKSLNIQTMIEDAFHNAQSLAQHNITTIMPRRPWNTSCDTGDNIIVVGKKHQDDARKEIKELRQTISYTVC